MAYECDARVTFGSDACRRHLSARLRLPRPVRLMTYSLPDFTSIAALFVGCVAPVQLIAGARFRGRAELLKASLPRLDVALHHGTHAKIVLAEPDLVVLGSSNLGDSGWIEADAAFLSREAHDELLATLWLPAWRESERLPALSY